MEIEGDAFGKVYEYFLGNFAMQEVRKGGVFYTPTSIVRLIVEIIEPYHGRIYDPACGSGGMFVQPGESPVFQTIDARHVESCWFDAISETMTGFVFRRLCTALMVLTFLAGFPIQGDAKASQMSLPTSGEPPMSDGCTICGDDPAINMTCPVVFCLGLFAVVFDPTEFTRIPLIETWVWRQEAGVGLGPSPRTPPPPKYNPV